MSQEPSREQDQRRSAAGNEQLARCRRPPTSVKIAVAVNTA